MMHMTETRGGESHPLGWWVLCRCGWLQASLPSRYEARRAGDRHLDQHRPAAAG